MFDFIDEEAHVRKVAVQFKVTQLVSGASTVVNRKCNGVEERHYSLELCF